MNSFDSVLFVSATFMCSCSSVAWAVASLQEGAFEDMLEAARNVMMALGGELRDENMSVLSGQTVEHMRQRISDYSRRRLSRRASTLG